jgi:predicted nuclease of restriction endonuclease-like RecB superfamily
MLTGRLLRARLSRNRVLPAYLDAADRVWLEVAERLISIFRDHEGRTRGALDEEVRDCFGSDPAQLIHQGLAKLLGDRCEFEVISGCPPEQLRDAVFRAAAAQRCAESGDSVRPPFRREIVLAEVASRLDLAPVAVDQGLFADLKSEQRLVRFRDITAQHLLERYNVALAQAVLLRSTGVHVTVRGETPARYRQLFRQVKFHRLVCEVGQPAPDCYRLHLDGPLSLFSATQKYGLQLALFLPAVLRCRDFELHAEVGWGSKRKPATFTLAPSDGLVAHNADTGMYVPPELKMFAELFRKKVADWDIVPEAQVFPLGDSFWVPDFRLTHRPTGRAVLLEVLGFWRRSSALRHLERLRSHAKEPFLLAVSEQLRVDEAGLDGLPALIHRFRQMPLPEEVARLAVELLATSQSD